MVSLSQKGKQCKALPSGLPPALPSLSLKCMQAQISELSSIVLLSKQLDKFLFFLVIYKLFGGVGILWSISRLRKLNISYFIDLMKVRIANNQSISRTYSKNK